VEINTVDTTVLFNDLVEIITPYCKNDAVTNVTKETRFIEDLGVNSARLVDIVIDIEDKFNVAIDDESADKIRTIGDAIAVIEQKIT
jgi:acyl carrier protein